MTKPPEIVMVSTYRPPVPKEFRRRKRRWPKQLLVLLLVLVVFSVVGLGAFEWWLRHDLPATFPVPYLTEIRAASGELIGEVGSERRRKPTTVPPALEAAIVKRIEPGFLMRPRLGQRDFVKMLWRGEKADPPSLSKALAHRLHPSSRPKEWVLAMRLEAQLSRSELVRRYLDVVPFGKGIFGAEEGARDGFGMPLQKLSPAQLEALAERADGDWPVPAPPKLTLAPEYADAVARELGDRQLMGAIVVTNCDLALTRAIEGAIRRQKTAATVVVMATGTHELRALTGANRPDANRSLRLRPLVVIAAALQSLKWTAASPLENQSLRALAQRDLPRAAAALLSAGLAGRAADELAGDLGLPQAATPLEQAEALTTLASLGARRLPQLIRSIDGAAESENRRAPLQVLAPEVAWLTASMVPSSRLSGADWFVAWSADSVLVVEATRAPAIGAEILRALPSHPLPRPATLIEKNGEAFAPGSLPREEPALPPE
jgi:hypothetical protein